MILCCGEALIDMLPGETVDGQHAHVPHCGGAVFNTSIALGRLGTPVGQFTALSTDCFGQQLSDALAASHVDTALAVRSERLTTLAIVHLTDGHATYSFYDDNTAGAQLTIDDLPELPSSVSAMFFGGISLCNAPAADSYLALAQAAQGRFPIMLDPNVRPGFAKDEATYRTRLSRLLRLANIVKLSDDDLDWLFPGPDPIEDKARHVLTVGPKLVLLTRGSKGATAYQIDGTEVSVAAAKAEVIDTVGAGDTFNAGFLAALNDGQRLQQAAAGALSHTGLNDCLSFAAKVAAVTVSRKGANPPWRAELSL